MRLLIDQGNTKTKWQIQSADGCETGSVFTRDKFVNIQWPDQVEEVWLCSVACEQAKQDLRDESERRWGIAPHELRVKQRFGDFLNGYAAREQLGVDRWVGAIGAHTIYPNQDCIVIDAGTAITIDLVTANSEFAGGTIIPGFELMRSALVGNTAGIHVEDLSSETVIGKTTNECVGAGAYHAVIGGVERIVSSLTHQSKGPVNVLLCGGDADKLKTAVSFNAELRPSLIFDGIAAIVDSNVG